MIEYKIKFKKGGVTITQRMTSESKDRGVSAAHAVIPGKQEELNLGEAFSLRPASNIVPASNRPQGIPGGGEIPSASTGGGEIPSASNGGGEIPSASTGGEIPPASTGGGGPLSGGVVLVFGSLVIGSTAALGREKPSNVTLVDEKARAKGAGQL